MTAPGPGPGPGPGSLAASLSAAASPPALRKRSMAETTATRVSAAALSTMSKALSGRRRWRR